MVGVLRGEWRLIRAALYALFTVVIAAIGGFGAWVWVRTEAERVWATIPTGYYGEGDDFSVPLIWVYQDPLLSIGPGIVSGSIVAIMSLFWRTRVSGVQERNLKGLQMAELKINQDTILDGVGALLGGYIVYHLTGGDPIPVLKDLTPYIAGVVAGLALWRHLKKH